MTNKPTQLAALIKLMDEPDDRTFNMIQEKIFTFGAAAITELEQARENSLDDLVQQRIKVINHQIRGQNIKHELIDWMKLGSSDLLQGFLLQASEEGRFITKIMKIGDQYLWIFSGNTEYKKQIFIFCSGAKEIATLNEQLLSDSGYNGYRITLLRRITNKFFFVLLKL